ncbi:hypothetical protein E4U47_006146 [Claviceps purpurea]|nr:hypothetical protein E4U47_006146 [Claviceps purpurea]
MPNVGQRGIRDPASGRGPIRRAVADRSEIPLHRVLAATRTKMGWAIKPTDAPTRDLLLAKEASWTSTLGASKVDRHESIDVLEAAKEEVLTQTAWQPVDKPIAELQDASFANRRSLVGATVSLSPILSSSE